MKGLSMYIKIFSTLVASWLFLAGLAQTTQQAADSMMSDFDKADYYYTQQQYDKSVAYALKALPTMKGDNEADCLNLLAISYIRLGDYNHAAQYAQRCYELDVQSGDQDCISSSLNTLANIYMAANRPEEAEGYVLKGIDACLKVDNPERLAVLYGTASEIYHAQDEQQKALDYARKALEIDSSLEGHEEKVAVRRTQMAASLIAFGRRDEAKECMLKAMPVLQEYGNYHSLAICCNKMGELMLQEKNTPQAAAYFGQAAELFQAMGDLYNEVHSQLGLYNALKDSVPQEAMSHLERHNALKDTIYSREVGHKIAEFSAKISKSELVAEKNHAHQRAQRTLYISIAIILLAVAVVLFFYWQFRRKTREFMRQFNEMSQNIDQLSERIQDDEERLARTENSQAKTESDAEFLSRVEEYVNRQINEGHIDVAAIAQELCMSVTAFRRKFTTLINERPQSYIMRLRMERARKMLDEHPEMTISDVGISCGFDDKSNFTRAFKRFFGKTPSEYIER